MTKKYGSLILTLTGVAGFGLSLYLTAKETPKATKAMERVKHKAPEGEDAKRIDILKAGSKAYAPAIAAAAASVTMVILGQTLNMKEIAFLGATASAASKKLYDNRKEVKRKLGKSLEFMDFESSNPKDGTYVHDNELNIDYDGLTGDDVRKAFEFANLELAKYDECDVEAFYKYLLKNIKSPKEIKEICRKWEGYKWRGWKIIHDSSFEFHDMLKNPIIRYELIKVKDGVYAFEFDTYPDFGGGMRTNG